MSACIAGVGGEVLSIAYQVGGVPPTAVAGCWLFGWRLPALAAAGLAGRRPRPLLVVASVAALVAASLECRVAFR